MEFILYLGKGILSIPIWALIQSPFLRWSVKLAKASSISIRAAFLLGLISGAATLIVSLILYPFYELIGEPYATSIYFAVTVSISAWLYGYFLRGEAGNSIGIWRGFIVFAIEIVLFLAIVFAFAFLVVLVGNIP